MVLVSRVFCLHWWHELPWRNIHQHTVRNHTHPGNLRAADVWMPAVTHVLLVPDLIFAAVRYVFQVFFSDLIHWPDIVVAPPGTLPLSRNLVDTRFVHLRNHNRHITSHTKSRLHVYCTCDGAEWSVWSTFYLEQCRNVYSPGGSARGRRALLLHPEVLRRTSPAGWVPPLWTGLCFKLAFPWRRLFWRPLLLLCKWNKIYVIALMSR